MGRKVDMKKIEDITKCQVTFSKRRSSLIKKAKEISVCCDIDVAFVAFSPSGRISKFCSQKRIEDVLHRFVNLPADRRLNQIRNVQEKQEKLRQLDHIKGDTSKLQYLDKQIENLELQIKKSILELQILEADLRDYEPGLEQEPSLHQLSWCERNLKQSSQRVMARKKALLSSLSSSCRRPSFQMDLMEMGKEGGLPFSCNFDGREPIKSSAPDPSVGQLLMHLDPWISPYSAKIRESIFQDFLDQAKRMPVSDPAHETSNNGADKFPVIGNSQSMHKSGIALTACGPPNYAPTQVMGKKRNASFGDQQQNSPYTSGQQEVKSHSMEYYIKNNGNKRSSNNNDYEESNDNHNYENNNINSSGHENGDYVPALDQMDPQHDIPAASFDNLPIEDAFGGSTFWTAGIQKSGIWEWDDLIFADNFNVEDLDI